MAKKKKKTGSVTRTHAEAAPKSGELGTVALWLGAAAGVLFLLSFLAVPWISVSAMGKAGVSLISDALKAGNGVIAGALLFAVVPAALAAAAPFVPAYRTSLREWHATATAVTAVIEMLVLVIVTSSTRNLLAFGGGRQVFIDEVYLLYITLAGILTGAVGYLILRDVDVERDPGEAYWYGAFIVTVLVLMYFNYSIIPDSLIPPPEFIRERMGMMGG